MEQPKGPGESNNPSATPANYNIVMPVCHLMDVNSLGELNIAMHQNLADGVVLELCKNVFTCATYFEKSAFQCLASLQSEVGAKIDYK